MYPVAVTATLVPAFLLEKIPLVGRVFNDTASEPSTPESAAEPFSNVAAVVAS